MKMKEIGLSGGGGVNLHSKVLAVFLNFQALMPVFRKSWYSPLGCCRKFANIKYSGLLALSHEQL